VSYDGGQPVLVDSREGSADLYPMLQKLYVPSRLTRLEFGDAELIGRGPAGRPVLVGVEVKAAGDLLQCFVDGRLTGHQLPGLQQRYEIVYLVVEKLVPSREEGGEWFYHQFEFNKIEGWLATIEEQADVRLVRTSSRQHTAAWIAARYRWWNGKEYEQHRSHLKPHRNLDMSYLDTPLHLRRQKVAMALADGIGPVKARAVADHFTGKNLREMVAAGEEEWLGVPGIGRKMAAFVVAESQRREKA